MSYRASFNNVKQAKSFCWENFNGLDFQGVYHPREHHCATATWGGRAKDAHVHIIMALPGLFWVQSQMHAQQGWEMLISQGRGVKASPAIVAHQGSDMQMGATKEKADNTGAVNGTWSSDVLLKLLDLPFDGTVSIEVVPRILSGASRNQQGAITGATTATMLTQLSNIREVVNSGEKATGAVDPPAIATGSIGDGQSVAAPPSGGKGCAPMADLGLTILHRGGTTDIEMTSDTAGASLDQVPLSLSGDVHRVPTTSLVGIGVDGEDQTVAGEPTGFKGPLTVSAEIEVDMSDEQKGLETSPAQKRLPQSSMVTPRISRHIPINEAHLEYINSNSEAIKGIKNTRPCSGGNGETFVSMMVNHRNQGESPSIKVYEGIQKF